MSSSPPQSPNKLRRRILLILGVVVVIFLAVAVFGAFVIKRATVDYRTVHDFPVSDPAFFGSAHALGDPPPIEGNHIELLHNGNQIFPTMLTAIRSAKSSINFEAFLFYPDSIGNQFVEAFCERARAGVRVRVLLDALGSGDRFQDADVEKLRAAGCSFAYYHAPLSWRVDKLNRRTHRRVLVVDGKVGFTGGAGFADQWAGDADSPDHWREVHIRVEGPLVAKLQGAFQQHWVRETGETLSGITEFPPLEPRGQLKAQLLASHSFSISPVSLALAVAFNSAERTIYITNAYAAPSDNQVALLAAAAKRGVDVRLLVPGRHNDQPATKAAGRGAYGRLIEGGVKIFEYETTMIHTKTVVVDGLFSIVGSSNFDARSSQINEELDVTVYDAGFGRQMDDVFLNDLKKSRPYTLEQFKSRSVGERFSEWITAPFRSQL